MAAPPPIKIDNLRYLVTQLNKAADGPEINRAFKELNFKAGSLIADAAAPKAPRGDGPGAGALQKRSNYKVKRDRLEAKVTVGTKNYSKRRGTAGNVGAYSGIVHYGTGKGLLGRKRKWLFNTFVNKYEKVTKFYEEEIPKLVQKLIS